MKVMNLNLARARQSERGSAVLVMLVFLMLMLMLSAATFRAVMSSRREVTLIEKRQMARWAAATNAPPTSARSMGTQ